MVSAYTPITLNAGVTNTSASNVLGSQTSINNSDFVKIMLAQMANPDIGSLFGEDNNESSSIFGGIGSSFQLPNSLQTSPDAGTSFASFFTPQMELSIYSNLIGKNVEAFDQSLGVSINGKVKSVVIQDGRTYLEVGDSLVSPASIIKAS